MTDWFSNFLLAFIPLFVALDPVGLSAIFLGLGAGYPAEAKRRIARQAVLTGGAVALAFLFLGRSVFAAIGITVSDFQVAGGAILFALAARDLITARDVTPADGEVDFGVVPLGLPIIAGPALIATLLALSQTVGFAMTLIALGLNLVLVALAFSCADLLGRLIGRPGLRAIAKIVSLLLAAYAVAMIRRGLAG